MTSIMHHHHIPFSAQEADFDLSSIDPFLLDPIDLPRSRKISMVDNNMFNIPLSPPTSPRMTTYHQSEQVEHTWQDQGQKHENEQDSSEANMSLNHSEVPSLTLDTKPMLRTNKSFPYTLRASGHQPDTPPLNSSDGSPNTANPDDLSASLGEIPTNEIPQVHFGGSAPNSPLSNLDSGMDEDDDLDGDLGLGIALDPEIDGEKKPMSAAEIRAQKRKMKRFRLTHNQTRFLMSEFARQAHPDAAHRERLAREIPGLTPRQVQVWFQNRRAKLKRLTSDDRERMMRSRALPDDFDMTQALHSPFGTIQNVNSNLSSPGGFSGLSDNGNMIRPLSLEALRRIPDGSHMSPIPGYGGFNFTPPQSVTDGMSPVSPAGPDSPFSTYSPSLDQQRRNNPFAGGLSSPSTFTSHPQIPRLQMHDRDPRSRPDSLNSPLRPALSYQQQDMNSPSSPMSDNNGPQGMMPYGLGYSYPQSVSGFSATANPNTRMRPFPAAIPRRIDISNGPTSGGSPTSASRPQYSPTSRTDGSPQQQQPGTPLQAPHSATFPSYSSSPLATSGNFGLLSAPHNMTTFSGSYLRHDTNDHDSYGNDLDDGEDNGDNGITAF